MSTAPSADKEVQELVPMRTHVCLPGDPVLLVGPGATVAVGGGLRQQGHALLALYCAPAQRRPHPQHADVPQYTLASPACRTYVPQAGDPVVAHVVRRAGQHYYMCYIAAGTLAYLDAQAFDGATKASCPRLQEGDVVYAYVKPRTSSYMDGSGGDDAGAAPVSEVELSCMAAGVGLPPKAWTSGEAVFGPLDGGQVIAVALPYARSLLTPAAGAGGKRGRDDAERGVEASYLLGALGHHAAFEACVGMNGLVWVRGAEDAKDPTAGTRRTAAVCACLTEGQADRTKLEFDVRVQSYFAVRAKKREAPKVEGEEVAAEGS
ncbi:exosome complex component RRP40 [Strigomonas culicis]|uniref:Exosome complex component RRP40 n=1 Tax=Strigomonas culicis TaxID=28005 RepID=S9UXE0_9TRYP|nr:exosome complex component RRP40 [Strigomonas culicis]|eukprot:EPY33528.1 exosome complex component RRP40 [Strigomonas culicis]